MKILMKLFGYIKKPKKILLFLDNHNIINLNDEKYLKLEYNCYLNKKLNLVNPRTYNEKLQWLKLNDRNDIYTILVDKLKVKEYVANLIGKEYIIPTIGVYSSFDEINFDELPNQFVIKCTHDSGGILICRDKNNFSISNARKFINKRLRCNYYKMHREWPYKNVKPKIIIEKYMQNGKNTSMRDYKFFCFNGKPYLMYLSEGLENHSTARISFYDMNFNETSCKRKDYKRFEKKQKKPNNFEKMKKLAGILSKNIPQVRIDFYNINGNVYFGEYTFFTCSGYIPFEDEQWDKKLGDMITIENKCKGK